MLLCLVFRFLVWLLSFVDTPLIESLICGLEENKTVANFWWRTLSYVGESKHEPHGRVLPHRNFSKLFFRTTHISHPVQYLGKGGGIQEPNYEYEYKSLHPVKDTNYEYQQRTVMKSKHTCSCNRPMKRLNFPTVYPAPRTV